MIRLVVYTGQINFMIFFVDPAQNLFTIAHQNFFFWESFSLNKVS